MSRGEKVVVLGLVGFGVLFFGSLIMSIVRLVDLNQTWCQQHGFSSSYIHNSVVCLDADRRLYLPQWREIQPR